MLTPRIMDTKSIFASKTVWFNVLSSTLTILGLATNQVPATWMPWILLIQGFINVILRVFFTSQPIG